MNAQMQRLLHAAAEHGCAPKLTGNNGFKFHCPAHLDRNASAGASEGQEKPVVVKCHAGCTATAIVQGLGLSLADLCSGNGDRATSPPPSASRPEPRETDHYDYTDEDSRLLYQCVRYEPKDFRQRRPNGRGWIPHIKGVRRVLYRLPAVLAARDGGETIYIVEGEKDADAINRLEGNHTATCNPMGAGKWDQTYADTLKGARRVVIVADNDEPGRKHARDIRASLIPLVERVELVEPAIGKDASDHLNAGRGLQDLVRVDDDTANRIRLSDVWREPEPETPATIAGWLCEGDRIVAVGRAKTGKSVLLTDLAVSLALGKPFLSWLDVLGPPRRVLYLDEEQSDVLARQRLKRNLVGRNVAEDEAAELDDRLAYLHRNSFNLDDQNRLDLLEKQIDQHRPDYILIDSLRRIHGRDENSNTEMSVFLQTVLGPLVDKHGTGLVVLAHPRKGELKEDNILDAVRGAGDIGAWADTVWGYIRDGDNRKLVSAVSRWDDTGRPVTVRLEAATGGGTRLVGTDAGEESTTLVLRLLDHAGCTGKLRQEILSAVQDESGGSPEAAARTASRALGRLKRNGDVSHSMEGKAARYWIRQHAPPEAENVLGIQ